MILNYIDRATAILIGPGFGLQDTTREFLDKLINNSASGNKGDLGFIQKNKTKVEEEHDQIPVVIDADGLKLMSKIPNWSKSLPSPAILTPHPGEMSVLTGLSIGEIQDDRIEIASKYAKHWGHIVVLKGAFTAIAAPDGQIAIVPIASAALARAGTGDVLAGLIVGFTRCRE